MFKETKYCRVKMKTKKDRSRQGPGVTMITSDAKEGTTLRPSRKVWRLQPKQREKKCSWQTTCKQLLNRRWKRRKRPKTRPLNRRRRKNRQVRVKSTITML